MSEEIKALLSIDCWYCGTFMTLDECSENDSDCPRCNAEIYLDPFLDKAIAVIAARDARIAELEEEVKTSAECLDMANDLYSTFKRENDQLRAELVALNAKLDASKFCANVADDLRAELAAAKETITRYETTAENCEVLRAELAAIKALRESL